MTVMQVLNAMEGYYEKEADLAKVFRVLIWSPVRWSTWVISNMWRKKPVSRPDQLIKFDWDTVSTPKAEEIESLLDKFPDRFGS